MLRASDGKPDPDVWAIGDAAIIKGQLLPATAQGKDSQFVSYLEPIHRSSG